MSQMGKLSGCCALVTGASRGFGALVAEMYWREGAHIVAVGRSIERLLELQQALPAASRQNFLPLAVDLEGDSAPHDIIKAVEREFGRLDILVNNAGIQGPIGSACNNDWLEWQKTIHIDLLVPVQLCRLAMPLLMKSGHGRIINLSGGGATGPRSFFSAYATAKAGLVRFSETLAEEVRDRGVTVNCIAPGAMPTDMLRAVRDAGAEKAGEKEYKAARKALEAGEGIMERAAELAVYLASDASAGLSGRLISAQWDPWPQLGAHIEALQKSDIYTLRRIVPRDRGFDWG